VPPPELPSGASRCPGPEDNPMTTKTIKAHPTKSAPKPSLTAESYGSEADFDDTIAKNRALPLLAPESIPTRPHGFVATDPKVRARRLRRVADDHRAEGHDALLEVSKVDLRALLGKRAPDPKRAAALAERLEQSAALVARAERVLQYANEIEEIALSDALVLLEATHKEVEHEASHDPNVADHFPALTKLFAARSTAIVEGIARKNAEKTAKKPEESGDGANADA
jgi:hypothetical protein